VEEQPALAEFGQFHPQVREIKRIELGPHAVMMG
jgi:hypothetical protein